MTLLPCIGLSSPTERAPTTIRSRLGLILLGAVAVLSLSVSAWGYWTNAGQGSASGITATLNAPANVAASAPLNSSTVSVTWSAATLSTGQPASGYFAVRVRTSDGSTVPACGTSLSATTTALSCSDLGVFDGDYSYRVTSVSGSWTAVGVPSSGVHVVNDTSKPSVSVTSISPLPNGNGYNNASPVVVNLAATSGLGIASLTYTIDSGTAVTVQASTAAVSVSGNGIHTVTFSATDTTGQSSETGTVLIRIDTAAPLSASAPVMTAATDTGASTSDGITKLTTPTFTGTAEAESTVTLYDGVTPVGSGTATGGTYTIAATSMASGTHTLTARATDIAGNTGPASPGSTITIDTTAPLAPTAPVLAAASDSGTSSSDRLTNVTTPILTGTAENGSTVTLYSTATAIGSAPASGGAYSVTSSVLTTGAKTLTAKATDVAGNLGPASASTTITIDVTAPSKPGTPVLAAASDTGRSSADKNTSVTTPTLTGTVTAGSIVTLYDGGLQIASLTTATATYSFIAPALANASHIITTKATDPAGNLGPASTAITVTIDTIAPVPLAAPFLSLASDTGKSTTDKITKTTQPIFTGINETKAIVVLFEGASQRGTVTTTSTTYSITSAVLSAGSHTLTATPTDIAGNVGPTSAGSTITIDTTAPVAPSAPVLDAASDSGSSSTDAITKVTIPSFSGTAEVGATVGLFDGPTATGTAVTAVGGNYTAVTATLTNGTHLIAAKTTDIAGNVSPVSSGTSVTIDTVLPTVTMNQAAGQADPTSGPSVDFTVIFSETVTGFASGDITNSGTAGTTTTVISGAGPTYTATLSGMTKTGTVFPAIAASIASDVAGNLNAVATYTDHTVNYVDTTAPAAPSTPLLSAASDTGTSSSDRITKTTTPIFTGTAEIGSTVRLFDGATQVGSVVAAASTYSITSSALTNGVHTITATATDVALNVSAASSGTSVTIDTVLPTVTMNQAAGQADPTSGLTVDFTVIFSETITGFTSSAVTNTGTAGANTAVISGGGATYTATLSGMTKTGTVVPAIAAGVAQDTAGNLSAIATYTDRTVSWVDATAPAVAISAFTAAGDASQTATITGTAGHGLGDNLTVTVVLCAQNAYPCIAGNTKATLSGVAVNAGTGAWTVTSGSLGTTPTLYARATQTDLSANTGTSTVAGPLAIP